MFKGKLCKKKHNRHIKRHLERSQETSRKAKMKFPKNRKRKISRMKTLNRLFLLETYRFKLKNLS